MIVNDDKEIAILGLVIILIILVSFSLIVVSVYSQGFNTNKKEYNEIEKKATIKDKDNNKLGDIILLYNTDYCMNNCYADIFMNVTKPTKNPFDKLSFYKNNKNGNIRKINYKILVRTDNYTIEKDKIDYICNGKINTINGTVDNCNYIKNGTYQELNWNYIDYNDKDNYDGEYYLRINGIKKSEENIEWIPQFFNTEIEEWANWNSTFDNGLFAYYNFSSTIEQINGYTLTEVGNPVYSTAGALANFQKAGNFTDATDDGWNITNEDPFDFKYYQGNLTINVWANSNNTNVAGHVLISKRGDTNVSHGWKILHNTDNKWLIQGFDDPDSIASVNNINTNKWEMLTIIKNSSHTCLYVNATKSVCVVRNITVRDAGDVQVVIGHDPDKSADFFGGIDELAFWNRSLSSSEINDIWNDGLGLSRDSRFGFNITLLNPSNNTWINKNTLFNSSIDSLKTLKNASLYGNWTNTWHRNQTISLSGITSNATFILNATPEGTGFAWNVFICDINNNCAFNETNFTIKGIDSINPNLTIINPLKNQTITILTPDINITANDTNRDSCWYNLTTIGGASTIVNTQINNCLNATIGSGILTDGITYNLTLFVNDSANNFNISSLNFTIDLPDVGGGGSGSGGGGGGGSVTLITSSGEPLWNMETDQGAGKYEIDLVSEIRVVKGIRFENIGTESRTITLSCKDIEGKICQYVKFDRQTFSLPLIKEVKTRATYSIELPEDIEKKSYTFNIVATDDLKNEGIITNVINISLFGNIRVILIKLGAYRNIFGYEIHYGFLLLMFMILIPILSFYTINNLFFNGKGLAINIIIGFFMSFILLIFI